MEKCEEGTMRGRSVFRCVLMGLVLLGVVSIPWGVASAVPPRHTVNEVLHQHALDAVHWLHSQQHTDGTFGSVSQTADAVLLIAMVGENPDAAAWTPAGVSALRALQAQTPQAVQSHDAGIIAKVLRAVAVSGVDVHHFGGYDLVAELERLYNPSTGRFDPTNNFKQALAIEALVAAGTQVPAAALQSLANDQRPNGGWGWQYGGTAVDVDTTGLVLEAIGAVVGNPATFPQGVQAYQFLQAQQAPNGGWPSIPGGVVNCDSTALAIRALLVAGQNPRVAPYTGLNPDGSWKNPLGVLLGFQDEDGGFRWTNEQEGSKFVATTDTVPALALPWPGDQVLWPRGYFPLAWR